MVKVKECDEIMSVRLTDPRNFKNLKSFFELAIPSILIIFVEGCAYNTQVIIGGTISPEDQVFVVLVFNIALNSFAIPFGLSTAITSLMGQAMGECNIPLAKKFYKISVIFSMLIMTIQMSYIWFYQVYIFEFLQHVKSEFTENYRK